MGAKTEERLRKAGAGKKLGRAPKAKGQYSREAAKESFTNTKDDAKHRFKRKRTVEEAKWQSVVPTKRFKAQSPNKKHRKGTEEAKGKSSPEQENQVEGSDEAKAAAKAAEKNAMDEDETPSSGHRESRVLSGENKTKSPKSSGKPLSDYNPNTAFVVNLPKSATPEDLNDFFADCGKVVSVRLPKDGKTGRMKGFGYVTFESEKGASKAIQEINGQKWRKRVLMVQRCRRKKDHLNSGNVIWVKGLKGIPATKIQGVLRDHFGKCGTIQEIRAPTDTNNSLKGFAFVEFASDKDMQKALELNQSKLELDNGKAYVLKALKSQKQNKKPNSRLSKKPR